MRDRIEYVIELAAKLEAIDQQLRRLRNRSRREGRGARSDHGLHLDALANEADRLRARLRLAAEPEVDWEVMRAELDRAWRSLHQAWHTAERSVRS